MAKQERNKTQPPKKINNKQKHVWCQSELMAVVMQWATPENNFVDKILKNQDKRNKFETPENTKNTRKTTYRIQPWARDPRRSWNLLWNRPFWICGGTKVRP